MVRGNALKRRPVTPKRKPIKRRNAMESRAVQRFAKNKQRSKNRVEWGKARGNFRARGNYGSAGVRG